MSDEPIINPISLMYTSTSSIQPEFKAFDKDGQLLQEKDRVLICAPGNYHDKRIGTILSIVNRNPITGDGYYCINVDLDPLNEQEYKNYATMMNIQNGNLLLKISAPPWQGKESFWEVIKRAWRNRK